MAKKLLSMNFENLSHTITYNLGCSSPDNIPEREFNIVHDSNDKPLSQVGCIMYVDPNNINGITRYSRLYQIANNLNYGTRAIFPKDGTSANQRFYLNGQEFDSEGNPMPYIMFEGLYYEITYYNAQGVRVGPVFSFVPGGPVEGGNAPSLLCGELYTDGTFTGDYGGIKEHSSVSTKRYDWGISGHVENREVIYANVIEDLQNYLPVEPEGEWTDTGEGDFDASSDFIDFPNMPDVGVVNTGLISIYQMTTTQLKALSRYLWTTDAIVNIKKMFNNPMEAIINLCLCPLDFTSQSALTYVKIGNETTEVQGSALNTNYKIIDFGTINLHEYWGDFADYSPYTKLSIYLPYTSGVHPISIDDVMRGSITLKGYCDVSTGSIIYMLYSSQSNPRYHGHQSVLYSWSGNIMYQIPLSSANFSQVISSVIGAAGTLAGAVGATIATGGATAPMAVGAAVGTIGNMMNAKTHIQRGGSVGGAVGLFGIQHPYLILERPEIISPTEYPHLVGVPDSTENFLSNISGYVTVKGVDLEIERATENEVSQIETLLKGGVYI